MIARDPTGAETWLLSLEPTRRQTRWVVAVAVCQVVAVALFLPFANIQLARINAFIPAFEGVIFVTNLVTSVLLFSQFANYRLRALLVLACGYLFAALMIIPHMLTFPGAFSPTGLLGAGIRTTRWLHWFWHFLFPLALLGYGLMRDEKPKPGQAQTSSVTVIVRSVALVLALVCGLTLFATAGHDYLPGIRRAKYVVWAIAALVGTATLLVIWRHRRSLFDQWLLIVTLDVILEMGIVGLDATRFSVAFYASRLFSLLISTIVLVILLVETMRLYAKVARSNEAKIRRLVDANILGVCIWSLDGAVVAANEEFLRTLKYDHQDVVSGRIHWTDLTPPELRERDARAVVELRSIGSFQPFEKEYLRRDGSRVPVLVGGALFEEGGNEGVAFVLDLTERKRAEAEARESEQRYREVQLELAHAGRLATLGQLTASIVHEINQPIAANILSAETAQRWLSHQPPNLQEAGQAIDRAVKGGKRAMDIVGRIRALVKKAPTQKDELELNEAILEVIGLARGEMSKNGVRLQTRLSGDLPLIRGDRVQLQQVMLNLVINAVEAMCQVSDDNRELMISTHTEGDCVLVAVRDSGPGLSQVDLERAFEAFYTTKSSGLGMGLSICRSIVEAHKGRLWAANIPKGAVFRFTVPIHA